MSRRVGRVGLGTGPGENTDFDFERRVEHHTVVGSLVEVDRIEVGIGRIGVAGRRMAGHRTEIDLGTHLGVADFRRVFRLDLGLGLVVVGRREDSPAVLDCSNFRQTFYFTKYWSLVEGGMFWFEDKVGRGSWGGFYIRCLSAIRL